MKRLLCIGLVAAAVSLTVGCGEKSDTAGKSSDAIKKDWQDRSKVPQGYLDAMGKGGTSPGGSKSGPAAPPPDAVGGSAK